MSLFPFVSLSLLSSLPDSSHVSLCVLVTGFTPPEQTRTGDFYTSIQLMDTSISSHVAFLLFTKDLVMLARMNETMLLGARCMVLVKGKVKISTKGYTQILLDRKVTEVFLFDQAQKIVFGKENKGFGTWQEELESDECKRKLSSLYELMTKLGVGVPGAALFIEDSQEKKKNLACREGAFSPDAVSLPLSSRKSEMPRSNRFATDNESQIFESIFPPMPVECIQSMQDTENLVEVPVFLSNRTAPQPLASWETPIDQLNVALEKNQRNVNLYAFVASIKGPKAPKPGKSDFIMSLELTDITRKKVTMMIFLPNENSFPAFDREEKNFVMVWRATLQKSGYNEPQLVLNKLETEIIIFNENHVCLSSLFVFYAGNLVGIAMEIGRSQYTH